MAGVTVFTIWRTPGHTVPFMAGKILTLQMFATYHPLPINCEILASPIFYVSSILRRRYFSAPYLNRYIV